jgi:glycosyltransferase involved in cell wall biosynthesis
MRNAHLLAALIRGMSKTPLIVNSCYNPKGPRNDLRSKYLYRFCNDGLVVINKLAEKEAVVNRSFSPDAIQIAEPGVDLDRFSPERKISENRKTFGLMDDVFVIGMVTRIRESRRIDLALAALHALADEFPHARLLVVGRGTAGVTESVVTWPARKMGISDKIILPGYCDGDRLVAAYRAMDVLVYPVPGTDKSCRTVREAMASGVPVIASRIGFLPDLIEDNLTGRLVNFSRASLATILRDGIKNKTKLRQMGRQALNTARLRFSPRLQAEKTLCFYTKLLKGMRH